jgi:hypothetical protein
MRFVSRRVRRSAALGVLIGLGAVSCGREPRDNAYDPTPSIGVSETVSVGVRGTEPGGAYSSRAQPEQPFTPLQ